MSWKETTEQPAPPPQRRFELGLPGGGLTITHRHRDGKWWMHVIVSGGDHVDLSDTPPYAAAIKMAVQRLEASLAALRAVRAEMQRAEVDNECPTPA